MVGPIKQTGDEHVRGRSGDRTGSWYCQNCGRFVDVGDSRHGCPAVRMK
jgi:hypothetical protein